MTFNHLDDKGENKRWKAVIEISSWGSSSSYVLGLHRRTAFLAQLLSHVLPSVFSLLMQILFPSQIATVYVLWFFKNFNWSIVDLQCCVNFFCTAKWLIYVCVYILEKAMATHSTTLAWKIPWVEESGRLQSMGSQRAGHDWATSLSLFFHFLINNAMR